MATNLFGPTGDRGVFLKALPHIGHFAGGQAFRHGSPASPSIPKKAQFLRNSRGDARDSGAVGWGQEIEDSAPNPEKQYLAQERGRLVRRVIRGLRPSSRGVLERQHFQDYSVEEIAQMEGISVGAVKARLFHARMALRSAPSLIDIAGRKFMARQTTTGSRTGDAWDG